MKHLKWLHIFLFLLLVFALPCQAGIQRLAGTWINIDADTRGITKLRITGTDRSVFMQAWGKCHPKDCDWGRIKAAPYSNNVSQDMIRQGRTLTGSFRTSFSETFIITRMTGADRIRADVYTRFTDNSNRNNYYAVYQFKKQVRASGTPGGSSQSLREDCIRFNPDRVSVQQINNRWKIVDGSHWIMDFETNRNEAMQSLQIIKRFRFDSMCFVGRPDPSFTYFLSRGNAPAGSVSNEDCLSFNNNAIQVKLINNRWKIVEGNHYMFDFGSNKAEAIETYKIIKKYRFTKSCFVGRPGPSMTYMKR